MILIASCSYLLSKPVVQVRPGVGVGVLVVGGSVAVWVMCDHLHFTLVVPSEIISPSLSIR